MTVYVVQDTRRYDRDTGELVPVHDVSPAQKYGTLKFLLSPSAAPWNPESIVQDLWDGLQGFGDDDYLLMIGNPVFCGMATAIAADVNKGMVKFLQWHGKDRCYLPIQAQVFVVAKNATRG